MNADGAKLVIRYLCSAYPNQQIADGTVAVWCEHLAGQTVEDAMNAAKRLVRSTRWFPSVAEFLECCRLERELREANFVRAELTAPKESAEQRKRVAERFMAVCRESVASRNKKQHWHGGPDPCPVCGGMKPQPTRPDPSLTERVS